MLKPTISNKLDFISAHKFTYELWRNGCLEDVGIFTRTASIKENRGKIANMVIGYCDAGKLYFRAKPNCIAIMLWDDRVGEFWTHFTKEEFEILKNYECI